MLQNIYVVLLAAQVILFLGVGVYLFCTRGPKKTWDEEVKQMQEDGLKTYRR